MTCASLCALSTLAPESLRADTSPPALQFDAVSIRFAGARSGEVYTAVREASLAIASGEFVSIVGPTGCGKSTLLNVAAGLLEPSSGEIRVFGAPLEG